MPALHIVVIGASAGGLDAVRAIVRRLPKSLSAAIFIVIHTSPEGPALLANILHNISALPVTTASDGDRIERGHIYVAPPDYHLVIEHGHVRLNHGPREHRFRPAIDPLFRSAAAQYGTAVIGIVLSGYLADGTHGLMVIKERGGTAIAQDPSDALVPSSAWRWTGFSRLSKSQTLSRS